MVGLCCHPKTGVRCAMPLGFARPSSHALYSKSRIAHCPRHEFGHEHKWLPLSCLLTILKILENHDMHDTHTNDNIEDNEEQGHCQSLSSKAFRIDRLARFGELVEMYWRGCGCELISIIFVSVLKPIH